MRKVAFIVITILSFAAIAGKSTFYKWVDSEGNLHFSAQSPQNKKSSQVEINTKKDKNNRKSGNQIPQTNNQKWSQEYNQKLNSNCEKAQKNLKQLSSNRIVHYRDDEGNLTALSPQEILVERKLAQEKVDIYCK